MTMKFKRPSYIYYLFATTVLLFERSIVAGEVQVGDETNSFDIEEGNNFLKTMDQSVDPCVDFYNFTCGRYMKEPTNFDASSPGYERYKKIINDIKDILESERDIPGCNVSVARNIYESCKKIVPNIFSRRKLIDTIATKIELITDKYELDDGTVIHKWNEKFDWIDGVHKLRNMGLNFRFLVGLYVSPRSQSDKRNILEVRKPVFESEDNKIRLLKEEKLEIVNAGEFIDSLNGSFPLQKLIEGFLPEDVEFSLDDNIRVDEAYIKTLADVLKDISASYLAKKLYRKLETEIERLTPTRSFLYTARVMDCLENAIYYDYSFQAAVAKTFFTEKKKQFVTEIIYNVMKSAEKLINASASFNEESRIKSIQKLSDLQLMIGYGNNIIETPKLDWNDVDYNKYVNNIFTLSKHQMDAKFRQLNLINDVREWEFEFTPSTFNAGYFSIPNSLYMPAMLVSTELHKLDSPSYIHYGSFGFTMAHELGHVIDISTKYDRSDKTSREKYSFARSNVNKNKACLHRASYELAGEDKKSEVDDFADLAGYKIAYYSFLDAEKRDGYEKLGPGLDYNSRQMFWITSASGWCNKNAFEITGDSVHSPDYARVLIPLSQLPEFARDFHCPVGSPMNPDNKCEFL